MKKLIAFLPLLAVVAGCSSIEKMDEDPIAEVGAKKLYISEIKKIFPSGIKPADSLLLLNSYVESWTRKQILLITAEDNLSEDDKDVSEELDDYRTTLLINRYEQQYINSKLDTVVDKDQMQRFYQENASSFILPSSIVKALFVKVSSNSEYVDKFKDLMNSNTEQGLRDLENLGHQAAESFDYFNDKWVFFSDILSELPEKPTNIDEYLSKNSLIVQKDTAFTYLVSVKQYKLKGSQSPFDFERENIRSIILNKRKHDLIEGFELSAYSDAKKNKQIKIHIRK